MRLLSSEQIENKELRNLCFERCWDSEYSNTYHIELSYASNSRQSQTLRAYNQETYIEYKAGGYGYSKECVILTEISKSLGDSKDDCRVHDFRQLAHDIARKLTYYTQARGYKGEIKAIHISSLSKDGDLVVFKYDEVK